ncbi:MAG: DUF4430 domain-containing protein [Alphaproteobacteria bacterium]|nr:MAG: DUF4430 domain-containing protein [Alphaproteobacteria bacterium]
MKTGASCKAVDRRIFLGLLAAMLVFTGGFVVRTAAQGPAQTVRLIVDYGDGMTKIFDGLAWSKGNTVLDVLNRAQAHPHGITFAYTGSGASAFLTKIDDLQNQGGGSGAKNWQYWVNTTYADRSFAVFEVQALDTVFWRFAGGGK